MENLVYVLPMLASAGTPLVFFFIGVAISLVLRLHGDTPKGHIWCMSLPVAMLCAGMMLNANSVTQPGENGTVIIFTFMTGVGKFLNFGGMMMLLGTMVPQLFKSARDRVMTRAQGQIAGE
ncbi:hypothetical protein KUV28_16110 [Ferrimonas balearica]|nr:hypothetical protein [Ferrimonas balearica]